MSRAAFFIRLLKKVERTQTSISTQKPNCQPNTKNNHLMVCVFTCVGRTYVDSIIFRFCPPWIFVRQGLSLVWNSLSSQDWLSSEPEDSLSLPPQSWDHKRPPLCPVFYAGSGDQSQSLLWLPQAWLTVLGRNAYMIAEAKELHHRRLEILWFCCTEKANLYVLTALIIDPV